MKSPMLKCVVEHDHVAMPLRDGLTGRSDTIWILQVRDVGKQSS